MKRILLVVMLGALCVPFLSCTRDVTPELPPIILGIDAEEISYVEDVKPILEGRCAVCHGCYDASCQLKLTSSEGLNRGANEAAVYATRLIATEPTRLFVDAKSTEEWREHGFYSVLEGSAPGAADSLLVRMLALGRAHPFAADQKLPDSLPLDVGRSLTCPTVDEFDRYARKQPLGGMPYGTAPLTDSELAVLGGWATRGEPAPVVPVLLPDAAIAQVAEWESFLNGESLKQRITARYLYEHWFLAHLTLEGLPTGPFFRIVRSSTPPGIPSDEIATRRPTDDPGEASFWYRLRPIESTIVHKTHIVYALSAAKMRRLRELFLNSDWKPTQLPPYGDSASNPFLVYAEVPTRSRYQFLLDDAQYFVMNFIRGDVCRGQVATDVIEDHFFTAFLSPDYDLSVTDPDFMKSAAPLLGVPAEHGSSSLSIRNLYSEFDKDQQRFLDLQAQAYAAADPEMRGPTLDYLWDGDGHNTNALLTIFRHHDNATVVRGFVGAMPKTAWVLDYPILERIYYNLVAGFDVFGNVGHQVSTRLYMDHLRMQGEDIFLAFLPSESRQKIKASWYVGANLERNHLAVNRIRSGGHATQIPFTSDDPKAELLEMLVARDPAISGEPDLLNRCAAPPCDRADASPLERRAERALQPLAGVRGDWVAQLPHTSFLRVKSGAEYAIYTLVHNAAHSNVAFLFGEDKRRVPADDTLTIVRDYLGSYPNFLFDVEASQIEAFAQALVSVRNPSEFGAVAGRYGVRRTSPRFWATFDWIHADFRQRHPTQAGLFDLARFGNF